MRRLSLRWFSLLVTCLAGTVNCFLALCAMQVSLGSYLLKYFSSLVVDCWFMDTLKYLYLRPEPANWAPRPILQTLVQVHWEPGPTEIVPNWAPHPILQTLVQVDWEPGPTEIVPNWAPHPILQTLVQVHWEPGRTEIVPNWTPHLLRPALPETIRGYAASGVSIRLRRGRSEINSLLLLFFLMFVLFSLA